MNFISNKNRHLTHEEHFIIETGIRSGSSKKAIADTLGKDKSTIGKEIKLYQSILINVNCLWNVLLMPNANMAVVVPLPALILSLFHVFATIVLQAPVTVMPDFLPAASTSLFINPTLLDINNNHITLNVHPMFPQAMVIVQNLLAISCVQLSILIFLNSADHI